MNKHREPGGDASLLATKLIPPQRPKGMVGRSRLTARAGEIESHLLTLVKAPAGFGKTTLALEWMDALKHAGHRAGWFTVDAEDDDAQHFLHYLYRAVLDTGEKSGAQPPFAHGAMGARDLRNMLLNQITDQGDEVFIVVDNYHCVTHPAVHEHMAYLLAHAPSNFHLVLLSQAAPPFSLVRLQIQGQLLQFDAALLSFTMEETASLLGAGGYLEQEIVQIHAATRGWPAALRVALLTRGGDGGNRSAPLAATLPLQQMLAEWLDHMPAEQADLLEKTAVIERFCGPLCTALTGDPHSERVLDALEKQHPMITRLDANGVWYGYHQLLRDALLRRLRARDPDLSCHMHRRASHWFAGQALWLEAVRHALAAGDADQALEWIETCAMPLVKRGDLATLLGWERQLGSALLKRPVKLRLAIAWARALGISGEQDHRLLDKIEAEVRGEPAHRAAGPLWECQAIRAILLARADDTDTAYQLARECAQDPAADSWMMNAVHNVLRYCHLKACRWDEFDETLSIPYEPDEFSRNVLSPIYHLLILGMGDFTQLRAHGARRHLSESVQLSERSTGRDSEVTALCAPLLAQLLYELMEWDSALELIDHRLDVIVGAGAGAVDGNVSAFTTAARIACHRNEPRRAHLLLKRAESVALSHGWPRLEAASLFEQMRLHLRDGKQSDAWACMTRIAQVRAAYPAKPSSSLADLDHYWRRAQGHYALAQHRFDEAITHFAALYDAALARRNGYLAIICGSALALAHHLAGDHARAGAALSAVIALAAPAGMMAAVLDQGPEMRVLLAALRDRRRREGKQYPHAAFIDALIVAGEQQVHRGAPEPAVCLSNRERDILDLVAELKSNKEIARSLGITPETVKSHIKNILGKLSVGKRMQAAQRAGSLGLLRRGV